VRTSGCISGSSRTAWLASAIFLLSHPGVGDLETAGGESGLVVLRKSVEVGFLVASVVSVREMVLLKGERRDEEVDLDAGAGGDTGTESLETLVLAYGERLGSESASVA
jgi:hypothetical protein